MISKSIIEILNEFDQFLQILKANEKTKKYLTRVCEDIKLIELWRQELESSKQSIFVVGKMSTGKSTFLNFLLDNSNQQNDIIFKTATSTETGLIQTLEHCKSRNESFAKISIKNLREFKKLEFPSGIRYKNHGTFISMPLDNIEQIGFFRDWIIAKSKNNSFDTISAIDQVDIKYPLKYFKNFKIIDTPGLDSHKEKKKDTDKIVRTNYHGKSNIFWFLNASKRTMSDDLTLLVCETELLRKNYERVHFIANQYDEQIKDDENIYDKINNAKRIEELSLKIKTTLEKIINITVEKPSIIFTSFKNPHKNNKYLNTISDIQKLEEKLLLQKTDINYNNICFLKSSMTSLLNKLEKVIVTDEKKSIEKTINKERFKIKGIEKKYQIIQKLKKDLFFAIDNSIDNIQKIEKEKKLSTHERYNKYLNKFKDKVKESASKIKNAVDRIDSLVKFEKVWPQLIKFKTIDDFSLKEKETFWKKKIHDSELDMKKEKLMKYVLIKIDQLNELKSIIAKSIEESRLDETHKVMYNITSLEGEKKNIDKNHKIINSLKSKLININGLLLNDLEENISEWSPDQKSEKNNLFSFLQLYSLIEEHKFLTKKN